MFSPHASLLYNNWRVRSALQINPEIVCFLLGLLLWRQRQTIRHQLEELRLIRSLSLPLIKFLTLPSLGWVVTGKSSSSLFYLLWQAKCQNAVPDQRLSKDHGAVSSAVHFPWQELLCPAWLRIPVGGWGSCAWKWICISVTLGS